MALKNIQYDTIIREYQQKQLQAKHDLDQLLKKLYEEEPRIQELDQLIATSCVQQVKSNLAGDEESAFSLKHQISDFIEEKSALLARHNMTFEDLEPKYHCKDCKDTGYIDNEKCHCFKLATINTLYSQSNIRDILQIENFQNFRFDYYSEEAINPATKQSSLATVKVAVEESLKFVRDFDKGMQNIFFYGDTGVGKTFLSNCIAKELIDTSHSVIYFSAFQLFDALSKNIFDKNADFEDIHQHIFECDLLIIDDLGTELTNSFVTSQFFLCVNERLLRKKSTIISTNLTIDYLVRTYSERIFSRISSNYTMIRLFGDDIRLKKKLYGDKKS